MNAKEKIASEITSIMKTYREQQAAGYVDTPGGLEHMGDVWNLLWKWDEMLKSESKTIGETP